MQVATSVQTRPAKLNTSSVAPSRRHKGVYGVPLSPQAEELMAALLVLDDQHALGLLCGAVDAGWGISDIEDFIIAPAVTRLGQLWLRGRLTDDTFTQMGNLAERVEWSFRHRLVAAQAS